MRHLPLVLTLALTSAALAHAGDTFAQSAGTAKATAGDEAQRLYQEGNDAYKKGDLRAAETAYLKAWALARTFDVAANLGVVELELKKFRDAADYLAFSLRNAPPSSKAAQRDSTRQSLEEAKKHVLTMRVTMNVAGARLSVDGQAVAPEMVAAEVFVTPGKHVVEATHPDNEPAQMSVEGVASGAVDVVLTLKPKERIEDRPLPSATPTGSAATSNPPFRSAIPVFALGGGALVAAGFGIALNVSAAEGDASSKKTADAIRAAKGSCVANAGNFDSRCGALESQARSAQTLSGLSVGLLVGAGALATGAVIYLFLPGGAPVKVGAIVAPDGGRVAGALNVGGRF